MKTDNADLKIGDWVGLSLFSYFCGGWGEAELWKENIHISDKFTQTQWKIVKLFENPKNDISSWHGPLIQNGEEMRHPQALSDVESGIILSIFSDIAVLMVDLSTENLIAHWVVTTQILN